MAQDWKPGDICYWCDHLNGQLKVSFGMICCFDYGAAYIDYLAPKERRRVNGIPIEQFTTEKEYRPLPKGWSYDTEMFRITWDEVPEKGTLNIRDPASIAEAVRTGLLVKKSTIFDGSIDTEITGSKGHLVYRLVKKWPSRVCREPSGVKVLVTELCASYSEAEKRVEAARLEKIRVANLSDEEANDEEYPRLLSRHFDARTVERMMAALRKLPNYGDIEIKVTDAYFEDGDYRAYYRYFSPPNLCRPIPSHTKGRETKAQRAERMERERRERKERFFREWTPIPWEKEGVTT